MISIVSEPERIMLGETLKVKLDIEGKVNENTYKNKYFNIIIKKNGGTHGNIILYPLKFIGCPLEWDVNSYSYSGTYGTFNVVCTLQNSNVPICNTTFVVEPDSAIAKASSVSNITGLLHNINIRKGIARKQEEKPEYFQSHQVQKQDEIANSCEINYKEKEIEKKQFQVDNEINKTNLLNTVKVQRAFRNC
jgi:hypothetical protein